MLPKWCLKLLGNNKEQYEDDYLERKIFTEIEQNVERIFSENNLNSNVKINDVIDRRLADEIDVNQYLKEEHLLIAMVVVNESSAFELIDEVLKKVKIEYPDLKLKTFIYLLSKDNYDRYIKYVTENEEITRAMIRKFMPIKERILS